MYQRLNRSFLLLTALLLVHLLFFLSTLIRPPITLTDSSDYLNASKNLYGQGVLYCGDLSLPIVEEQFTRRPPFYPILLGMVTLTGAQLPAYMLQLLISLLSIYVVTLIFFSHGSSWEPGHPDPEGPHQNRRGMLLTLGMLMLVATPAQFIYSNRIMAEITFQLLLVLMTWSVYQYFRARKDPRAIKQHYIWLFNLFLTLGMATKPVLFPFAIVSMVLSLLLFIKTRKWAFLVALSLPILWIAFYSTWNYNRTGSVQYSSIQTANMVNYNLRYYLVQQHGNDSATAVVDGLYARCGYEMNYQEKIQCLKEGVIEIISKKPLSYGFFHLKGVLRYFLDPGRFDLVTFFNLEQADAGGFLKTLNQDGLKGALALLKKQGWALMIILVVIALFKFIKIAGFVCFLIDRNQLIQLRIFLAILVAYLAMVTGPLGASRFYLPVELLVIGGAAAGWMTVLPRKKPTS